MILSFHALHKRRQVLDSKSRFIVDDDRDRTKWRKKRKEKEEEMREKAKLYRRKKRMTEVLSEKWVIEALVSKWMRDLRRKSVWLMNERRNYMISFDDEELDDEFWSSDRWRTNNLIEIWWLYVLKTVDMTWWIIEKIILMWQLMLSFVAVKHFMWW